MVRYLKILKVLVDLELFGFLKILEVLKGIKSTRSLGNFESLVNIQRFM